MLFIPIEGVFAVIMQHDNTIYQYAYNKQIVIGLESVGEGLLLLWDLESGEVQRREFAVIYFCCSVVCLCGFDFIFEISNMFSFAVDAYPGLPLFFILVPFYSLVF